MINSNLKRFLNRWKDQNLSLLKKNLVCPAFSFSLGLGRLRTELLKVFLRVSLRAFLLSLVLRLSSLISLRSKSLTKNRVGITWFWLTYLMKGLTLVFLMNFFLLSVRLTRGRCLAIPATKR